MGFVLIGSFSDRDTEAIFYGAAPPHLADIARVAQRKLAQLDSCASLADLAGIRGNRLEALKGKRRGEYSIRINDRLRIVFRWADGPQSVKIEDYH